MRQLANGIHDVRLISSEKTGSNVLNNLVTLKLVHGPGRTWFLLCLFPKPVPQTTMLYLFLVSEHKCSLYECPEALFLYILEEHYFSMSYLHPPVNTVGHRIISCTLRLAWCLYTVSILSVFWWLDKLLNLRMIVSQQLKFGFFFFESLNQSLISPVIKYSVYFIVLGEMFHISLMSTDLWMDLQRCLNYWLGDKPWLANNDLKTARTFPLVIGHLERAYETSKKIVGV